MVPFNNTQAKFFQFTIMLNRMFLRFCMYFTIEKTNSYCIRRWSIINAENKKSLRVLWYSGLAQYF